ncbi:MAG TPA: RNA chaperone ProQ [Pseudidiomarina sp.]|nr:RNA chaperone ProQ [Pseudidiomarina sp.]
MSEVKKLSNNKDVLAYLVEKFPACFSISGEAKPLKIGIFEDLAARLEDDERVSKTRIRTALRHYTNSWRYLRAVKEGAMRVDLDGADAGLVEADHQQHALDTLAQSKAVVAERKKEAKSESPTKTARPATTSSSTKRKAQNKGPRRAKTKSVPVKPQIQTEVATEFPIGKAVFVNAGNTPVAGVIVETIGNDVHVQLHNGLTVKVNKAAILVAK